jgi:hypothetical protein
MPTPARGPQTTLLDEGPNNHHDTPPSAAAPHSVEPRRLAELSSAVCSIVVFFIARRAALGFLRRRPHAIARSCALRLDGRATRDREKATSHISGSRQTRSRGRRGRREPRLLPPQPCSALLPLSTAQRLVVCVLPVRIRIRSLFNVGHPWARMARCLPVTSVALAASLGSSASDVSTTIEPIPRDTMPPWDTKPPWDTVDIVHMPDTVPYGIPCRCEIP